MKAYFRRAKAHAAVWNFEDARKDFRCAANLDSTISRTVAKELQAISEQEKHKQQEEREKLQGKMFT